MTDKELIKRWQRITGITSTELVGFFQTFRPSGHGLPNALDGVSNSTAILPRLLDMYQATEHGDSDDAYFVVRAPIPLPKKEILGLAESHIQKFLEIGRAMKCKALIRLLQLHQDIEIVTGDSPISPGQSDANTLIDEVATDFVLSLSSQKSQILLLKEAIYNMTCDTYIRDYTIWPLYQESTNITEPFQPYFTLWKHGAGLKFDSDNTVTIQVPYSV